MIKHYLRLSDFNMIGWLENYKEKIPETAKELDLTEDEVAEAVNWCDDMIKTIKGMDDIRHSYRSASEKKKTILKEGKSFIQAQVKRLKTAMDYTEAIGQDLGIVSTVGVFDLRNFRPEIKLRSVIGGVELSFTRGETDGVNIYRKSSEEKEWAHVCNKVRSPYLDTIANSRPVKYEYKVCAHIDHKPVGIESSVESITV